MKKRIFALTMATAMTVGLLSGCGGGADTTPAPTSNGGDAATAAIKIGGAGPLTGAAAIYGNAAAYGAQIAAEEINALGAMRTTPTTPRRASTPITP